MEMTSDAFRLIGKVDQAIDKNENGSQSTSAANGIRSGEEKRQRVAINMALGEYYRAKVTNNGYGDAVGLLAKLKELFEQNASDKCV